MEPEPAFRHLQRQMERENYQAAVDGLQFFTLTYSGSSLVDSAQFLLGEAHYGLKEFILAGDSFAEVYRRYPRSPLAPEAMFREGECYYRLSPRFDLDQEMTGRAMEALQSFIDYYPDRRDLVRQAQEMIDACRIKLAQKEHMAGIGYLKTRDYVAAALYFRGVVERYYDTDWAAESAFRLGEALVADGKSDDGAEAYRQFIVKYPDHQMVAKAREALARIKDSER